LHERENAREPGRVIVGGVLDVPGRAWITGFSNYAPEDDDPFPEGFTVGDIW
jgi:proline racemase